MLNKPLRIAIVAHGRRKIPIRGWGAVENIIWQYATRLSARGHKVFIVNAKWRLASWVVLKMGFRRRIDICHVHNDKALLWMVPACKKTKVPLVSTSHYFFDPSSLDTESLESLGWLSTCRNHIVLNADVQKLILDRRPDARALILPNGAEVSQFNVAETGNGMAICVGKLQARKRQRKVARLLTDARIVCHFVGPLGDENLEESHQHLHLGEWTREELRNHLTDYSVLVLWSKAEGQALVVVEALAAGLSIVISKNARQNLNLSQPFIYVATTEEELTAKTQIAIENSDKFREQARSYAEENFDFDRLVIQYESILRQMVSSPLM